MTTRQCMAQAEKLLAFLNKKVDLAVPNEGETYVVSSSRHKDTEDSFVSVSVTLYRNNFKDIVDKHDIYLANYTSQDEIDAFIENVNAMIK